MPHLFAMQRRSIFGCTWKLGLEICQSFLARAEAWRQRKRRSKESLDLVQNDPFSTFCCENAPNDCIPISKYILFTTFIEFNSFQTRTRTTYPIGQVVPEFYLPSALFLLPWASGQVLVSNTAFLINKDC